MKKNATRKSAGAKRAAALSVEHYLAAQPKEMRAALEQLRSTIRSVIPDAEEVISYQIPTYKLRGPLVAYGAFAKHCSFFVMSPSLMEKFAKELSRYEVTKGTIHFAPDRPLPATLVKKLVKERIKENNARKTK